MNPLLWITGMRSVEADRQHYDPGPIRQRKKLWGGRPEAFARHLRVKGRRVAIDLTTIPPGWVMPPEIALCIAPEKDPCVLCWHHRFHQWKTELRVGKNIP